jgi:hypothetical protein
LQTVENCENFIFEFSISHRTSNVLKLPIGSLACLTTRQAGNDSKKAAFIQIHYKFKAKMNASADKEECSQWVKHNLNRQDLASAFNAEGGDRDPALEIDPSNTAEVQSDLSSVEAETSEEEEDDGSSEENDSSS